MDHMTMDEGDLIHLLAKARASGIKIRLSKGYVDQRWGHPGEEHTPDQIL